MTQQHDWKTMRLVSRGAYYGGIVPDGEVQVRAWTATELARLNSGGNTLDRIESTLAVTTKLPGGLTLLECLAVDRLFLLLGVRTVTFGPMYTFEWRCGSCKHKNHHEVNLAEDLEERNVPEDSAIVEEPVPVTLSTGVIAEFMFLRGKEERAVQAHEKRLQKAGGTTNAPTELYRLQLQLTRIDGEPVHSVDKQHFIEGLSAVDLVHIEQTLEDSEPGLDLTVYPDCSNCGLPEEVSLPFDMEFFRPKRSSKK